MKLNLSKTKELVIRGRTTLPPPEPIPTIERVSYLKLLGVTFQDSPTNWNTVNPLLSPPRGLFFSSTFEGGLI